MAKRKGITPSLRWSVFARDGFMCRYCGAQAGQDGIELVVDHVISVVEGGDNRFDNLVTACRTCNGGKSGKSLKVVPTSAEVVQRINDRAANLRQQAKAIAAAIGAQKEVEQQIVNMKCAAYGVESVRFEEGERGLVACYVRAYGADKVFEWYKSAATHRVSEWKAIRYVCGCVRRYREELGLDEPDQEAPGA